MEVSPEYKQTDVGIIPEDWDVRRLGDVADLEVGYAFKSSWFMKNDGVALLRGENVGYGKLDWSDTRRLPENQAASFAAYTLRAGDIVIGMDRTFTKSGTKISIVQETDCPCLLVQRVGKFVPRKCNGRFLWALLSSTKLQEALQVEQKGMDIPHLSRLEILSPLVPIPPSDTEQRAIAAALSDVDAMLNALEALIAKKRLIKQGAMQELLTGKRRLPGFSGEWQSVKFEDLADKNIRWSVTGGPFGSNLKASDYVSEGVRIIQLQNIGDGVFYNDYAIYTSEQKANELIDCNIYPGEIILSKMGDPVARACLVPMSDRRYLMASDGIRLAVDAKRFDKGFVFYYINSPLFRNKAIEASSGSTRQRIGLTDLKNLPFVAPSLPEQTAIAEILSEMDAEIAALEARREKTRLLKEGMMQELLTGKIRLV